MEIKELEKALSKCKVDLLKSANTAFISTVCFSLKHQFTEDIPTACTDGKNIYYNPNLFESFSPEHRLFVLLHETWHVAFGHCIQDSKRFEGYDKEKLNIAQDHVINNMLFDTQIKMPDWVCRDPKYRGMSTEEVYDLLPDNPKSDKLAGDVKPSPESSKEAKEALDDILVQAQVASRMAKDDPGSIPASIQVKLNQLTNPKLPWDRLLLKFFNSMSKNDYSFKRPNRRFMPDYYLPTTYSEALGNVAMAIDMSGSVSDAETTQFISDVHNVIHRLKLNKLTLVQFDTRVFAADVIKTTRELLNIDFTGRGGTYIEPVMKWAEENKPDVLVVFSDGWFNKPKTNPKVPILWIIHNNPKFTSPFGKVIHYTI